MDDKKVKQDRLLDAVRQGRTWDANVAFSELYPRQREDMHNHLVRAFLTAAFEVKLERERKLHEAHAAIYKGDNPLELLDKLSPLLSNYPDGYPSEPRRPKKIAQFKRESGSWYSRPKKGK